MGAVAAHLKLPDGRAPSIPQFKQAAVETRLPMSFKAVYGAFENRWDVASRVYEGKEIPRTPALRSVQRAILGRNRTSKEPLLTCLRLFLAQDPPPASTSMVAYREWAQQRNENLARNERRVIEQPNHIYGILRTNWRRCLAVARNELTLEQARALTLSDGLTESGPLIGHYLASWFLGLSPYSGHAEQPGYPQPVVCFDGHNWYWLRSHIEEFKANKRDFGHKKGALEDTYVEIRALATLLNAPEPLIRSRVIHGRKRGRWIHVPAPTGKAGRYLYWERARVHEWQLEQPATAQDHKRA